MNKGNQQNPAFRQYQENIKRTERIMANGGYDKPNKKSKSMGDSRRSVEVLIEQRNL